MEPSTKIDPIELRMTTDCFFSRSLSTLHNRRTPYRASLVSSTLRMSKRFEIVCGSGLDLIQFSHFQSVAFPDGFHSNILAFPFEL